MMDPILSQYPVDLVITRDTNMDMLMFKKRQKVGTSKSTYLRNLSSVKEVLSSFKTTKITDTIFQHSLISAYKS